MDEQNENLEVLFKEKIQRRTRRTNWEIGIDIYTLICIK